MARQFLSSRRRTLAEIVGVLALVLVMLFVGLALTGPSIGNVFSTTISNVPAGYNPSTAGSTVTTSGGELNYELANAQQQNRVILRDATLRIVVTDTLTTLDNIEQMSVGIGGWVVTANSSTSTRTSDGANVTNGSIVVRVPAERLDEALGSIREGALEVTSETIEGMDVTEEYIDLSGRLENLRATETQLANILETAETVEDVLAVQVELSNVRGQLEQIEGRLRYFDEAAAFSSVTVNVREQVAAVGNVQVAGWNPLQTASNALGGLIVLGQFLADSVIVLAIFGVPLGALFWVARRVTRRLRGDKHKHPTPA